MSVYFIQAGEDGPVKIGYAANAYKRLEQIQPGNPVDLILIREIDGAGEAEEVWPHEQFRHLHIRREWHRYAPEMLTISVPSNLHTSPVKRTRKGTIYSWRCKDQRNLRRSPGLQAVCSQYGALSRIALDLGISKAAVSNWTAIPDPHLERVSELTGISVETLRGNRG